MYAFDRQGRLVGYARWPWDVLYFPQVGCFRSGRLQAVAECNLTPVLGLPGPAERCWFAMALDPDIKTLLEAGDPSVQIMRLEDGAVIAPMLPPEQDRSRTMRVEDLLTRSSNPAAYDLSGFVSFLTIPIAHKVAIVFLDMLGRMPDPEAHHSYGRQMAGGMSLFVLRRLLVESAEFRERTITSSERPGSLMTSALWKDFRTREVLAQRRQPLRQLKLAAYADASDEDFVSKLHVDIHGDLPAADAIASLASLAASQGRGHVAGLLVRDAALSGYFLELIDD